MGKATRRVGKPALAGAAAVAGFAGAVAAGRALRPRRQKAPGLVAIRSRLHAGPKFDADALADGVTKAGKHVGRAGKQLSRIAVDVQKAGQTAERVGKLLSK